MQHKRDRQIGKRVVKVLIYITFKTGSKEWSALEPAVVEHKYYAQGIGFVLVTTEGENWKLSLIEMRHD